MGEKFSEAMRNPPPFSNTDDPSADRLGTYADGGELDADQGATERVHGAIRPQAGGTDSEVTLTGGPVGRLGGPRAADPQDDDPGLPGHDQPVEGRREGAAESGTDGSFADRLDR